MNQGGLLGGGSLAGRSVSRWARFGLGFPRSLAGREDGLDQRLDFRAFEPITGHSLDSVRRQNSIPHEPLERIPGDPENFSRLLRINPIRPEFRIVHFDNFDKFNMFDIFEQVCYT